jgi:hypothetical protein
MTSDFMSVLYAWHKSNPDAKGMPISGLIDCMKVLPSNAVLLLADYELVRMPKMDLEGDRQSLGPTLESHDIVLRIGQHPTEGNER